MVEAVKMKHYLMFCALLALWSGAFSETCIAPSGREGECVSIYNCTELLNTVKLSLSDEKLENNLKLHHCGFSGDTPKVCCVTNNDNEQDRPSTSVINNLDADQIDAINEEDSSLPSSCGEGTYAYSLIGATIPELGEYPWVALIGYETPKGEILYRCGGALINQRYVITAAHCIVGSIQKEVGIIKTIRLGDYDTANAGQDCIEVQGGGKDCGEPAQDIDVHAAVALTGYRDNKDRRHDIGIIRLAKRVNLTEFVSPICLDAAEDALEMNNPVHISGWGVSETADATSKTKTKQSIRVLNRNICNNQYKEKSRVDGDLSLNQICAGGDDKEACQDSGGPLMRQTENHRWTMVGVLSQGNGCSKNGLPGVYTRVANYLPEILASIKTMNTENFPDIQKAT